VKLKDIIQQNPSLVHHRDAHGWEAIHEAVRDGNLDIVKILLNEGGANIDARVGSTGQGGSALWLAKKNRDASHPLIVYLLERGAQSIAPTQTTNKKVEL
jgi:ankyrin repeat protein